MHEEVAGMSITQRANAVLEKAHQIADRVETWSDFSLLMYDADSGVVARTFPSEIERAAFFDSEEYEELNRIQLQLMKKTGLVVGSKPKLSQKSGRFNVRVPKSLHQSLEIEAKRENVSLNQLAVAKLAIPLRSAAGVDIAPIVNAFTDVHDGYSSDRVVADPDYNAKYLRRCRELGMEYSDFQLNHTLYNIRKSKKARDRAGVVIPRTTKKTEFDDFDSYRFASEIAVRVLQRTKGVTLDRILCDPKLASEFDKIALSLVNQTVLKLRWAALNLRKTHNLKPVTDNAASQYDLVSKGPVKSIDLNAISAFSGLYAFYDSKRPLFASETSNLRDRLSLHLKYGIPCVDLKSDDAIELKTFETPNVSREDRVQWLMNFITREHPLLNYQRAA
jgi:HicB family